MTLARITNVMCKFCLDTVDFELLFTGWFETGHHDVDGTKDNDSTVDHLSADFRKSIDAAPKFCQPENDLIAKLGELFVRRRAPIFEPGWLTSRYLPKENDAGT